MRVCCMVAENTNQLDFLFMGKQKKQTETEMKIENQRLQTNAHSMFEIKNIKRTNPVAEC